VALLLHGHPIDVTPLQGKCAAIGVIVSVRPV